MKYTHKGWFGFCPVLINNPYSGSPQLCPRAGWLMPVMRLNIWIQELAIGFCTLVNPEWEPVWKIRLTGKL
jgi:hypothetical protein